MCRGSVPIECNVILTEIDSVVKNMCHLCIISASRNIISIGQFIIFSSKGFKFSFCSVVVLQKEYKYTTLVTDQSLTYFWCQLTTAATVQTAKIGRAGE